MRLTPQRPKIERALRLRGVKSQVLRHLMCTQVMIADISLALGIVCAWFTLWPLAFGIGATIAMYSFWSLASLSLAIIADGARGKYSVSKFVVFNVRLVIFAIILYIFIIRLRVPVAPMVAGLSSMMFSITLWGLSKVQLRRTREI